MNDVQGVSQTRKELEKIMRKVDQTISAYSILRDKFKRLSTILDVITILLSAMLAFLAVADISFQDFILPPIIKDARALPIIALLLFCISIIQLKLGWKEKCSAYAEAAKLYSQFKHELIEILSRDEVITSKEFDSFNNNYKYLNSSTERIPDGKFLILKQKHKRKIAISKILDDNPFSYIWFERMKLIWRDSFTKKK